ncbi:SRPBCC domain-containing protein [Salinimicrobium sp. CAU 1759]
MEGLEIKTAIQISRPQKEVFEGIIEQEKMSNYFISHASGNMEEGKTVEWTFPEFSGSFPVKIMNVNSLKNVIFEWEGIEGSTTTVEIQLEKVEDSKTLVKITEGKLDANENGILWYGRNTAGWANFLASLKAYLEYGINLRKGAFDFMKS